MKTSHIAKSPPLRCRQLSKRYGDTHALKAVSLELGPGVTAVLGQNGAGKTTLIRCALGLERPTSGAAELFGSAPRGRSSRLRVGVMLQDTDLPDLLTGRELITLFASYYPAPMATDALVHLTRIGPFVDKRYKKLSGGQKRRIQFAIAIVGNPDLVFLDEPTTGLDSEARRALWETVRGFVDEGRSVVLTTHYLEEADALADRVIILKQGKIISDAGAAQTRARVSGSLLRFAGEHTEPTLQALPAVMSVNRSGRLWELRSSNAPKTLRALLEEGTPLDDLTVSKPRLENIFEELSQ